MESRKIQKLASLEKVTIIKPVPQADKLERIEFDDCVFIARKGTYHINQPVVVVRAGAILPKELAKKTGRLRYLKNHKVKCLKIRNTESNCIIFALSEVFPTTIMICVQPEIYIGLDVSSQLGITAGIKHSTEVTTISAQIETSSDNWKMYVDTPSFFEWSMLILVVLFYGTVIGYAIWCYYNQ